MKVGITGGIGSGKSTVCKIFEKVGVSIYYADDRAKYLTNDKEILNKLKSAFGSQVVDSNNKLNKKYISELIFTDKSKLDKINQIIHPAVQRDYEEWIIKHKKMPYTIKEAAILIESGAYKKVDFIILVIADIETRINRVIKRDNSERKDIELRMKNQLSDKEKMKFADFIIYNNGDQLLIPQVLETHKKLLKLAKKYV